MISDNKLTAALYDVAMLAVRNGVRIDRVVTFPEGGTAIYIFGGEPNEKGTHPRHVGIVDDEGGCLSVFMRDRQNPSSDEYFDIADVDSAIVRIAKFIRNDTD